MSHAPRLFVFARALDAVEAAERVALAIEKRRPDLADQLRRAATSAALNTAEGANEFNFREKLRFYRMARRSAAEAGAALAVIARVMPSIETEVARNALARVEILISRTMTGLTVKRSK